MNVNTVIRQRALGLASKVNIDFAIDKMTLKEAIRLTTCENPDIDTPKSYGPLASAKLNNDIIAIANEDGCINLMKTSKLKNLDHWVGHDNAIFDIKATPDSKTLLTASGDKTIKHWDVETKKEVAVITPHYSSIKSISIYDSNIVASGSRDGCIKVHDFRCKDPTIFIIRDAHRNLKIAKPRRSMVKTDPISCVTNVVFDTHFPRIYSTGANDATIKLWDLRRNTQTNKPRRTIDGNILINQPRISVHHPSKGLHCGYSHLLVSGNKVFAACSDNRIYCYDNFGSSGEPVKFLGYHYDTYLKMSVIDDRFLVSGAKGGGAILWSLGNKRPSIYYPETIKQPIGQLKPDNDDSFDTNVIETDWDSLSVFTFRDDRLVCKWTMQDVLDIERKKLVEEDAIASQEADVTIEMSDIIDINVLRPNYRLTSVQVNT